jgi:hypothetical protein
MPPSSFGTRSLGFEILLYSTILSKIDTLFS